MYSLFAVMQAVNMSLYSVVIKRSMHNGVYGIDGTDENKNTDLPYNVILLIVTFLYLLAVNVLHTLFTKIIDKK